MESAKLSVIVPLGPGEQPPLELLASLADGTGLEVIVSAVDAAAPAQPAGIRWLTVAAGRGRQLNAGAGVANGQWLWFVHADSRLERNAPAAVARFMARHHDIVGYCGLRYRSDGPRAVLLNALGANLRSRLLGLPYGDQGLCVSSRSFRHLGGFREDLERGEDLDFVVRARRAGLSIRPMGLTITTSARRYRERGWLATTVRNQLAAWRLIRNARRNPVSKRA